MRTSRLTDQYRIVYAPGVYDILHAGHRRFLKASKALGDLLIAGVVSDEGTYAYKRWPMLPLEERMGNVRDLRYVDLVVPQATTDPTPVLIALDALGLKPAVLTHGDDWNALKEGNETLRELGIEFALLPYGPGRGTTGFLERFCARADARAADNAAH